MGTTVIEKFITQLGFDFDDKELSKLDKSIKNITVGLAAVVTTATAAATAIFLFTQKIAESNDQLNRFAQSLGIDIEAMQELGYVAELNKGSIDSMNSSLASLTKLSSEAARGLGAGVEVFGILGLSATDAEGKIKRADNLLLEIADSISKLGSQAEKLEFAEKLGFGRDMLLMLQQGSAEIKKQRQEARELGFVIDKDAAKAAENFADTLLRVMKVIQGVSNAIATRLMKQITPMMEAFVDWFKLNKKLIEQGLILFFEKMIVVIRTVFGVMIRVSGVILGLVNAMGGWKNSIIAVTALLLAMNASALLMPVLAIAAGAAILILLEDIIAFAEGGDSAIGNLAERFPLFDAALRTTLDLFKMVREGWTLVFEHGDEALEGLIMLIKAVGKAIDEYITDKLDAVIEKINIIPGIDIATSVSRAQQARVGGVGGFGGGGSTQTTTNNSSKPVFNFNINGGNQAEVRKTLTDVLTEQYSGATDSLSSTVEW